MRKYTDIAKKICDAINLLPPKGQLHVVSHINQKFDLAKITSKVRK